MQAQPTPIQANNNAEPVPEKCKVCKEFHVARCTVWWSLFSLFQEQVKRRLKVHAAKSSQQPLNDLRQNPKQEQINFITLNRHHLHTDNNRFTIKAELILHQVALNSNQMFLNVCIVAVRILRMNNVEDTVCNVLVRALRDCNSHSRINGSKTNSKTNKGTSKKAA